MVLLSNGTNIRRIGTDRHEKTLKRARKLLSDWTSIPVKPRSDRMEVDQAEGQKASWAILEQKDKRGGGSFKGTRGNGL